jgi:transposase
MCNIKNRWNMAKITLGIDISKAKFDAAVLLADNKVKTKKFDNKTNGFSALIEWLDKLGIQDFHACMEATGSFGQALATYLYGAGYQVSVVNPAQIKGFAQSVLARNKTDRADSILIARFCQAINPKPWKPAPLHVQELQSWVRRLEALKAMEQQEKNRLGVAPTHVKASIETIIKHLGQEMKAVQERIKSCIEQNPELRDKQGLLETIPGIGQATIARVLAFIGNPEDFKNAKRLSASLGLSPRQHQSGSSVHGRTRLSKTGKGDLRKSFYMPAIVAKQHNPIIRAFCEKLKNSGKPMMVIIGAAMRKLVHLIYGVLKTGKPFEAKLSGV